MSSDHFSGDHEDVPITSPKQGCEVLKNWFRKVGLATLACAAATTLVAAPAANAAGPAVLSITNHRNHTVVVAITSSQGRTCIAVRAHNIARTSSRVLRQDQDLPWAARENSCDLSDRIIARGTLRKGAPLDIQIR